MVTDDGRQSEDKSDCRNRTVPGSVIMAHIVINDLKESVELDRLAMRRITGGRSGPHLGVMGDPTRQSALFQKTAFLDPFNLSFDPQRQQHPG